MDEMIERVEKPEEEEYDVKDAVERAKQAVYRYTNSLTLNSSPETSIATLITDLRHLCDSLDVNWENILMQAEGYYERDCGGPEYSSSDPTDDPSIPWDAGYDVRGHQE